MNKEIQLKYEKASAENKKKIVLKLSKYFGMRTDSILNHWFGGAKIVPESKQMKALQIINSILK